MTIPANLFFRHIDAFFDYRLDLYEISSQTLKSNRTDLGLFENFIRSRKRNIIDGPAVIDFQYHLKKQRKNCGGSINRKIFTLRSYANFLKLYDGKNAATLPFYDVLKIRQGYRCRPNALTPNQIEIFFKSIDDATILGIRDYALYALMYQLGLRVGEVHNLDLQSLDFENSKITVMGKGRKPRTLHLNDELSEILSHYLAVRELFMNSWLTNALFVSKKGNRLAIRTMEDNFKKIRLQIGFKVPFNVTCHTLRHSLASHLNDNDVDVLVIQSILGHSSSRSTEPYIHPSQERIRLAFEKLPGVILVKELIKKGVLNLNFQKPYKPKRE
jgi:site-specific recombinase XerD